MQSSDPPRLHQLHQLLQSTYIYVGFFFFIVIRSMIYFSATFNYNDKSEVGSSSSSSSGSALGTDLDLEENYTSSLFQTEPLYQFYDINVDGVSVYA